MRPFLGAPLAQKPPPPTHYKGPSGGLSTPSLKVGAIPCEAQGSVRLAKPHSLLLGLTAQAHRLTGEKESARYFDVGNFKGLKTAVWASSGHSALLGRFRQKTGRSVALCGPISIRRRVRVVGNCLVWLGLAFWLSGRVSRVWSLTALVKSKPAVFRTRVSKNERGGAVIDGGMLDCGSTAARIAAVTGQALATRWLTPHRPRLIRSLRSLPLTVLFCEPRMNLI